MIFLGLAVVMETLGQGGPLGESSANEIKVQGEDETNGKLLRVTATGHWDLVILQLVATK